jgi:hypothetical protein
VLIILEKDILMAYGFDDSRMNEFQLQLLEVLHGYIFLIRKGDSARIEPSLKLNDAKNIMRPFFAEISKSVASNKAYMTLEAAIKDFATYTDLGISSTTTPMLRALLSDSPRYADIKDHILNEELYWGAEHIKDPKKFGIYCACIAIIAGIKDRYDLNAAKENLSRLSEMPSVRARSWCFGSNRLATTIATVIDKIQNIENELKTDPSASWQYLGC